MRSPLYKKDEDTIKEKVMNVAALMKIDHLMDRLPSQMSNGQRQRVALGRCLVRDPRVFLMDEPLAHLDAKLRHFMRAELKEMQTNFNATTIYVTHDYMEALSLGDRIAVINHGQIEQLGTGDEMYYTLSMNLSPGSLVNQKSTFSTLNSSLKGFAKASTSWPEQGL
jgi:multiple sugar transport system ATP-binding protein